MDNTIQLYLDKEKQIKGYPITSPDRVIDENGVNIKEQLNKSVKFKVVGEGITVPPINGGGSYTYDDTEIREMINEVNESLDDMENPIQIINHSKQTTHYDEGIYKEIIINADGKQDYTNNGVLHGQIIKYNSTENSDSYHHVYSAVGDFKTPFYSDEHDHNELGGYFSYLKSKRGAMLYGSALHVLQEQEDCNLYGSSVYIQYNDEEKMKTGFEAVAIDMSKTGKRATVGLIMDGHINGGGFNTGIIIRNSNKNSNYKYNEGILISDFVNCGLRIEGDNNNIVLDTLTDTTPEGVIFAIRNTSKENNFTITKGGAVISSNLIINNGGKLNMFGECSLGYNPNTGRLEIYQGGTNAINIQSNVISIAGERTFIVPSPTDNTTGATAGALKRIAHELYFHNGSEWKKVQLV